MSKKNTAGTAIDNGDEPATQRRRGRPRDPELRARIMSAAREHFLEYGLEGTSLERIAESAATSKVTLYNYFPSKEALFHTIANESRADAFQLNMEDLPAEHPFDDLVRIATSYIALITEANAISHMRFLSTSAMKSTPLAESFFDTGPRRVLQSVARYLAQLDKNGVLAIQDTEMAAEQFLGMLKGNEYMKAFLGLTPRDEESRKAYIQSCVAVFLRGYGRK